MYRLKFLFSATALLGLTGCIYHEAQDGDRIEIVSFQNTQTRAEMAYDSSVRVARLLEACGTPICMTSRTKIQSIGTRLIQHVNTGVPTLEARIAWTNQEQALLSEYSDAKSEAFVVLVDSGWAAPAGTDGTGSWDATWWDFSSP